MISNQRHGEVSLGEWSRNLTLVLSSVLTSGDRVEGKGNGTRALNEDSVRCV